MGVVPEILEHRRSRRHPRGEHQRGRTALECGQQRLRLVVGRVVGASVASPAPILVVWIAHERGRSVDRQHNRTRRTVGPAQGPCGERRRVK